MKRILIFSTAYFPHVGGAEVAIREITDRLPDGYVCDLICAKYEERLPSREKIGRVHVYRVGVGVRALDKLLSPFLGALLALSLKKKHHYDIFWAMMATYGSGGAYLANILSFGKKVPIVLTLQEGDPPEYIRHKHFGMVGLSWRLALARSTAVTVISNYLGELAQEFGFAGTPVLIPNGVAMDAFSHATPTQVVDAIHKKLGKKEGEVYLVTTSRLVEKNACDDVIRALALLPENIHFVIYGVGDDEAKLRALTKELSLTSRVHFEGLIPYSEILSHLHACDIFIRPSRSEGMGNSFIEAMAAGIPVIATQEGGIADFLFDARLNPDAQSTGFAVKKDSPEEIAEQVRHILAHPEEVAKTTENALAFIHERYDWDMLAKAAQKVFDGASYDTSARGQKGT